MAAYTVIGKVEKRLDAFEKVTGQAKYANDIKLPGMLYGKVKRSQLPHAKILNIDTTKAEKLPGVKAIVTGKEFSLHYNNPLYGSPLQDQPLLAVDKVRYMGEPVVGVIAVSEEVAEEAITLVNVEYEELPAVLDPEKAIKPDTPLIHEELHTYKHSPKFNPIKNSNICHYMEISNGDIEQGFHEADFIFEDTFTTQKVHQVPMEPRVAIAKFNLDESITIWTSDQAPYGVRDLLARALKIPAGKIRVIVPPYIGGGFGGKIRLSGLIYSVALAWKVKPRPVKLVLTREEEFNSTTTRHSSVIKLKTGVKKDGTIISRYAKVIYDTGAYADRGPTVLEKACFAAVGPYKIPNAKVEGYCVYTNKVPSGAHRGYGIPQVCWAYESQMDIIAHKLRIEPSDIRLKNLVEEGYIAPIEKTEHHAVGIDDCLRKVAENISKKKTKRKQEKKNIKIGEGIACGYNISRTPSGASASIKLNSDGSVEVLVSSVEMGQGVNTILSQIVSEELGIPLNNIKVVSPDTFTTPYFPASTSSRTTFFMGNAVKEAVQDITEQLLEISKNIFKTDKENLALREGAVFVIDDPKKKIELTKLINQTYQGGITISGRGYFYHYWPGEVPSHVSLEVPPALCWMYGAQGVVVEVDTDTGKVNVLKVVAAHDVGKAINPLTCEGQIEGGVVNGMGYALFEEMLFGKQGNIINQSLLDYKIPTALDIPQEINSMLVEIPHREGPYGAKGIGEMTTVPTAPAIANAIYDAIGVRIKDLPITQEKILKALKEKEKREKMKKGRVK